MSYSEAVASYLDEANNFDEIHSKAKQFVEDPRKIIAEGLLPFGLDKLRTGVKDTVSNYFKGISDQTEGSDGLASVSNFLSDGAEDAEAAGDTVSSFVPGLSSFSRMVRQIRGIAQNPVETLQQNIPDTVATVSKSGAVSAQDATLEADPESDFADQLAPMRAAMRSRRPLQDEDVTSGLRDTEQQIGRLQPKTDSSADNPSSAAVDQTTSEAPDTAADAGDSAVADAGATTAADVGADVGTDAVEAGLDATAAATADIPGLDIVTGIAALVGSVFGLEHHHHGSAVMKPPNLALPVEQRTGTTPN